MVFWSPLDAACRSSFQYLLTLTEDNVVVTIHNHDANVTPWVLVTDEHNASVRRVDFNFSDFQLDLEALEKNIDAKQK